MGKQKTMFGTALTDHPTTDQEGLGQMRIESDPVLGDRFFRWCRNNSGGPLAVGSLAGFETKQAAAITAAVNTELNKIIRGSGTWVAGALNGFYAHVLDDAGAAGAAPEGEVGRILSNTTTVLTLAANLTAAVTLNDTFTVFRPWHLVAAADGMVSQEVAGVLMATLADGEYGWVQCKGFHLAALMVAAGTTVAEGGALKAGAGLLVACADNADNGEVIAAALWQVTTDTVLRTGGVYLDCGLA